MSDMVDRLSVLLNLGKKFTSGIGCFVRLTAVLLTVGASVALTEKAIAVNQDVWLLLTEPLDLSQAGRLLQGQVPADGSIVTSGTISQRGLTLPSLWWADQQFGNNLLSFWIAHTGSDGQLRRVDLLVDQRVWTQYNYLERYGFIQKMGTSAQDFGYQTRVFNWRGELLGAYICDFATAPSIASPAGHPTTQPSDCNVFLDPFGANGLRGGATPIDGSSSTAGGTGQ